MKEQHHESSPGRWKARYTLAPSWGPSPRPSVIDLIVDTQNEILATEERLDSLHARLDYLEDYRTLKPFAEEEQNRLASRGNAIRTGEQRKQEFEIERLAQRAEELRTDTGPDPELVKRGQAILADLPEMSPESKARLQEYIELATQDERDAEVIEARNAAEEPDLNGERAKAARRGEEPPAETARERALKNLAVSDAEKAARRDAAFGESVRSHVAQQEAGRRDRALSKGKHAAQEPEEAPRRRGSYQGDPEAPIQSVAELNAVGRVREGRGMKVTPTPIRPIPAPPELDGLLDGERTKRLPWWRR